MYLTRAVLVACVFRVVRGGGLFTPLRSRSWTDRKRSCCVSGNPYGRPEHISVFWYSVFRFFRYSRKIWGWGVKTSLPPARRELTFKIQLTSSHQNLKNRSRSSVGKALDNNVVQRFTHIDSYHMSSDRSPLPGGKNPWGSRRARHSMFVSLLTDMVAVGGTL